VSSPCEHPETPGTTSSALGTHLVAVEEDADRQQRAEDAAERLVAPQRLDALLEVHQRLSHLLLAVLVVELERPQLEPRRQLGDGGQRQQELLGAAQWRLGACQLRLLDLGLLVLRGQHRQQFLRGGKVCQRGLVFGRKLDWPPPYSLTFTAPNSAVLDPKPANGS
jgi:hypothetical protein